MVMMKRIYLCNSSTGSTKGPLSTYSILTEWNRKTHRICESHFCFGFNTEKSNATDIYRLFTLFLSIFTVGT